VERERELEEFERLRAAARRGEGAASIVEWPAGIGKTRLLAAAGEAAADLEVLRARASELERDFPFGVVRQLFEPVFFAAGEERRRRLLAGPGGLAERVLSGAAVPDGGESGDPFAVLHGLYWFAANLAGSHRCNSRVWRHVEDHGKHAGGSQGRHPSRPMVHHGSSALVWVPLRVGCCPSAALPPQVHR
jgi:hypothetical protein